MFIACWHQKVRLGNPQQGNIRVWLARLLLSQASLWFLDEPFTALDVAGCGWLERHIAGHLERGGAVLFTSHQPSQFGAQQRNLDLAGYVSV